VLQPVAPLGEIADTDDVAKIVDTVAFTAAAAKGSEIFDGPIRGGPAPQPSPPRLPGVSYVFSFFARVQMDQHRQPMSAAAHNSAGPVAPTPSAHQADNERRQYEAARVRLRHNRNLLSRKQAPK